MASNDRAAVERGALSSLVPDEVVTVEVAPSELSASLLPEEEAAVARAVDRRRQEYAAGRWCARRAMTLLGVTPGPVVSRSDRAPAWPQGVVGSITHTGDFCAVALAHRHHIRSIGIDAEGDAPMRAELWERICTERERRWIGEQPEPARGLLGKVFFSAKEAFYKCQYPLSEQFLGFHDVELVLDVGRETFTARFLVDAGAAFRAGDELSGRYRWVDGLVLTAVIVIR